MIVYFLLIILVANVNIISGNEGDDETKYLETLPPRVKKSLLDRVARRILNEVPEVNSGDTDNNGDILAGKLEEQSVFVKRILKQEVESLKNKRRRLQELKKFRKSGDNNDQLSETPNLDKNEKPVNEMEAKKLESDKIATDYGHIDLTLRSGRSKRGNSGMNDGNTPKEVVTVNKHGKYDRGSVAVAVKLDDGNNSMKPTKDSIVNVEVAKVKNGSYEEIQIKKSKQGEDKTSEIADKDALDVVTKNASNVEETSTQNYIASETTTKSVDESEKIYIGKRSETLDLNTTEDVESKTTESVMSKSSSLKINSEGAQISEEYTTPPHIIDTTMADVKVNSTQTEKDAKNKTERVPEYSSKSYLENPVNDSEGRKSLENSENKMTQINDEISVKTETDLNDSSITFTEDPKIIYTETSYLTTIETYYETTTVLNQPLTNKPTKIENEATADLKEKTMKTIAQNNEVELKQASIQLIIPDKTVLRSGNASTNKEESVSSKTDANDTKIDDKKPCNQTNSKIDVITDCDKKLNVTDNSTTKRPNVTEAQKIRNESIVETTVDIQEPGPKASLRTGKNIPEFDSLIHFGDMQIKKEYEVYEVDSGKPTFVKQNEMDNNEKIGIEQPQYAPVYNYDPKNAFFNAYNRLGPNEDDTDENNDRDDESESHEFENEKILRSKKKHKLRMSKIDKQYKGKLHQKEDGFDSTTKPYYSKEASCGDEESEEKKDNDEFNFVPESHEILMENVRQAAYNHHIFGYVPTNKERKDKLIKEAKYLYNNILGNSTEEILDESKDIKQALRINDYGRYEDKDDAREDTRDHNENADEKIARKVANDDKKLEIFVIDLNNNPLLRQGGYFSSKYKWDEEGNSFRNDGKVYDLSHIVPYSTEKSLIVNQKGESNKIYHIIKSFIKQENDNNSVEIVKADPEDIKKTVDSLKNMDISKTLFNQTHIDQMVEGVENLVKSPPVAPPRQFQYLKQRLANLRQQKIETKTDITNILRTKNCEKHYKHTLGLMGHKAKAPKKFKAPNDALDTIKKITEITPEVDMYQNLEKMLQIKGLPIARSDGSRGDDTRALDDDLGLYVKILEDMVKMDNRGLEEYDWLGTTVAVQSALAKLKDIINQQKTGQDIHPADLNLLKYAEALYTKAREVTKEKELETIDDYLKELKYDANTDNNERMALPKTHRKIKNPWKILLQITEIVNMKVLRDEVDDRTKNFELFLDCLQQCLDDFHTAIREISRITKYKNQRWYKNIKELYLAGEKEHLELLLHLYSMKLFGLIEDSAQNGAQKDYRVYMKENRFEVDRTEAEIMFIMKIIKAIHKLKTN